MAKEALGRELLAMGIESWQHVYVTGNGGRCHRDVQILARDSGRDRAGARPRSPNIEVLFANETRVGHKNKITRRRARRRLTAPTDQRTAST